MSLSIWLKNRLFKKNKSEANLAIGEKLAQLERLLGFKINSRIYFIKALTHRSYLELEPSINKSNERLEFLGDSVLGLIVAEYLFQKFSEEDEGFLTKTRSHLVDKNALAEAAERMDLSSLILFNQKFVNGSSIGMKSILADAVEALISAIYIDQGLRVAKAFVEKWIILPALNSGSFEVDKNFKGQLLERTHSLRIEQPIYELVNEQGPEHDKLFTVNVLIGEEIYGEGRGKSKKAAEQNAAQNALQKLNS